MTTEELIERRDEISYQLIEANYEEVVELESELFYIENLLNQRLELNSEKESN